MARKNTPTGVCIQLTLRHYLHCKPNHKSGCWKQVGNLIRLCLAAAANQTGGVAKQCVKLQSCNRCVNLLHAEDDRFSTYVYAQLIVYVCAPLKIWRYLQGIKETQPQCGIYRINLYGTKVASIGPGPQYKQKSVCEYFED